MPAPLAKDPKTGDYFTVDQESGAWRPLNAEEWGNIRPSAPLQEMGVSDYERFVLKNFLNAGVASNWLKARGYEVMPYGTGLNFAVRKPGGDGAWRLVDPDRGGVKEFFRDMLDLSVGDVALPLAGSVAGGIVGTAAGGLPGAVLGGAAGGGSAEQLRQGIGELITGDRNNFDPIAVAMAGGLNAAAPVVGKGLGMAGGAIARKIESGLSEYGALTRGGETLLSRLTGIKPAQGMRVYDIISYSARNRGRSLVTPADVLDAAVLHMDEVAPKRIGTLVDYRDDLLKDVTVNMRPVMEQQLASGGERGRFIRDLMQEASPRRFDPAEAQLGDDLRALLTPPSRAAAKTYAKINGGNPAVVYQGMLDNWLSQMESVPAPIAARVRTALQKAVADAEGYVGVAAETPGAAKPLSSEALRDIRNFVGKWKDQFHGDLTQQGLGGPATSLSLPQNAVALDEEIHSLASARDTLRRYFGLNRDSAENAMRGVFNPGNERYLRALKDYDEAFPGVEFKRMIDSLAAPQAKGAAPGTLEGAAREAFIGSQFTPRIGVRGAFGLPEAISRPTATGAPLGLAFTASAIGGVGGFMVGGPLGAAAGGAAGFAAFSPATIVRLTPTIIRAGKMVRGAATRAASVQPSPVLGPTAAGVAAAALQGIARSELGKTMVRQSDASRPTPGRLFISGR